MTSNNFIHQIQASVDWWINKKNTYVENEYFTEKLIGIY